jgi:AraC-like DNA-binding protein
MAVRLHILLPPRQLSTNFFFRPQIPALQSMIHSIWQVDRLRPEHRERIVPKGIVEIIFDFSERSPIHAMFGDQKFQLPKCFINAFNTVPIHIEPPEHQVFFGVQLQPLAAGKLFKTSTSEFANTPVDLTLVDKSFHSLWHQLADNAGFDDRVKTFSDWVERKVIEWQPREKRMNYFLTTVDQHDLSAPGLADLMCYSTRQLTRKIREATGMNTEEFLRYKKYLHAVHLMHYSSLALTEIAHQSHFSDQAHFTKSFKSLTRLTPSEYRRSKANVMGHLYDNVR